MVDSKQDLGRKQEQKKSWWKDLALTLLLPRIAVALAGIGALVVGLKAAWEHNSATPALVVAGVLIGIALMFASDLAEFVFRYKEGEITWRRQGKAEGYAELTQALLVALQEGDGEGEGALRTMVAEIAQQAAASSVREAMQAQLTPPRSVFSRQASRWPAYTPLTNALAMLRPVGTTASFLPPAEATHRVEEESVILTLKNPPLTPLACEVTTPHKTYRKVVFRLGEVPVSTVAEVEFPEDFRPDAAALEPGAYKVEWRSSVIMITGRLPGAGETEFSELVASDEFEIPEPKGKTRKSRKP